MLDHHDQLFLTDESSETRVIDIIRISLSNHGHTTAPANILSLREQLLHQFILARQFNLNVALTQSTTATAATVDLETIDCSNSFVEVLELHIGIEGLASHSLHEDMNWLMLGIGDDASVTTQESDDLRTID